MSHRQENLDHLARLDNLEELIKEMKRDLSDFKQEYVDRFSKSVELLETGLNHLKKRERSLTARLWLSVCLNIVCVLILAVVLIIVIV